MSSFDLNIKESLRVNYLQEISDAVDTFEDLTLFLDKLENSIIELQSKNEKLEKENEKLDEELEDIKSAFNEMGR